MYIIKIRETTEDSLKVIGIAKDIESVFPILKETQNIEEVYLRYFEREQEIE